MSFDSDVAVLGTGVAPLVAANLLLAQGKSVLLLNPDWDFFLEDSELPLDPLIPQIPSPARLSKSLSNQTLDTLRPDFPGAIEFWHSGIQHYGFHDHLAPHVRQRDRLWVSSSESSSEPSSEPNWEGLEKLYVEASDFGLNPQILEGHSAMHRFPGLHSASNDLSGLLIPKLCDVDVARYRNGLLEFVRERLGPLHLISNAGQIERMPGGIRFSHKGSPCTARLKDGMLVFWTPRLSPWVLNQTKKKGISPKLPRGVRLWEHWTLNIERPLNPNTVGIYDNLVVWADIEGSPHFKEPSELGAPILAKSAKLAVLRAGPLVSLGAMQLPEVSLNWATTESFQALGKLCHELLKLERFSVQAFRPKAIFEWDHEESWMACMEDPCIQIISRCDGPLIEIVRVVRAACEKLLLET